LQGTQTLLSGFLMGVQWYKQPFVQPDPAS
jgi:hypothetical protein